MTADMRRVEEAILALQRETPSVRGVVLADASGLPIASSLEEPTDLLPVSAMSTLLFTAASRVFRNLRLDAVKWAHVEGDEADVLVRALPEGLTLLLLATKGADLSALRRAVEATQEAIQEALLTP